MIDVDPTQPPDDRVDEAISMEARVMLKGLSLPDTDPLPDDLKQRLRALVLGHIKSRKIPLSAVAMSIGIRSESTVSDVLRGKYKAEDSTLLRKLNTWMDDDERRYRRDTPLGIYDTAVLMSIRDAAALAKKYARTSDNRSVHAERARIVMAFGPSGIGKSAGGQAVAADDRNAIFIRVTQRSGTDSALAREIIKFCGWRDFANRRTPPPLVMERLEHTGRLLIVDEAHRLARSGFEFLRDLADVAGIPILLLGTLKITRLVEGPRAGIGNVMDDQFASRVAFVVDLLRGTDGRGGSKRPFFAIEEIVAIFRRDKIRLTEDGAEYLQAVACLIGGGMLRMAASIYDKGAMAAGRGNGVVDAALLRKAARHAVVQAGVEDHEMLRRIDRQIAENRKLEGHFDRRLNQKIG